MSSYILPTNGPTTVILDDNRDPWVSWRNHLARGSAGGVDLVAAVGTPIYAPADGTVSYMEWNGTGGHTLTLHQEGGWRDQFMHLSRAAVTSGSVRQGQLLGWTGATANGSKTGVVPHLHWHRIDPAGAPRRNPWDYFGKSGPAAGIDYAFGLTSDAQRAAQGALQALNVYSGLVDGQFGSLSVSAFQQYLKNIGLLPADYDVDGVPGETYGTAIQVLAQRFGYEGDLDGAPGENTSIAIIAWAKSITAPAPVPAPVTEPTGYAYGLTVEAMRQAQAALQIVGLYSGKLDGDFGTLSVSAMQQYLKNAGILAADYDVDGEPGPVYGGGLQTLAARYGYVGPIDNVPGEDTSKGIVTWANSIISGVQQPVPVPTPAPVPTTVFASFGIDVATSQADINFAHAKDEGVQFAVVKMGGLNVKPQYVAPFYHKQIDGAKAVGLFVGHYYLIGGGQSPEDQAIYFVNNLYRFDLNRDILALDDEKLDSNGVLWGPSEVARFVRKVIELTGIDSKRVWVYAGGNDFRNLKPWSEVITTGVRFWWASYGSNRGPSGHNPDHTPDLQGSIPDWDVHQYSSVADVAGYKLDASVSRLELTQLFAKGNVVGPVPEPTPTVPVEGTPGWVLERIALLEKIIIELKDGLT
jgi:peptidoglycan hydrolase-like protein with peptidoglycan-binding domain/GH25 family lysozyme M1 (1,4-beta-N-acetylmuramidase)